MDMKPMIIKAILLKIVLTGSVALLLAAHPAAGQTKDKDQAIKLKSELVELRVVVTDKKGQLIDNLKQEDFEVIDNGKPQPIGFFSVERIESRSSPKTKPDAVRPAPKTAAAAVGRSIVFFVDTLHLSAFSLLRVKAQLRQFIDEQMTDQDVAAIVTSSGTLGALQQFMRDKSMLKYAIAKITPLPRSDSLFTVYLAADVVREIDRAITVAIQILVAEEGFQPLSRDMARSYALSRAQNILSYETYLRRTTLITLKAVSERLSEMPGQRLMLFLSDGFSMLDAQGAADRDDLRAATGRAARSGVVIYSIEAKGLTVPAEFSAATSVPVSPDLSLYNSAAESDAQSVLNTLAADTGGEVFLNRNDLKAALAGILDNNRVYYVLAFYPEDATDKKKFRGVQIRVKTHPEYKVRAQKGYVPFEASPSEVAKTPRERLVQSMVAPLPSTAVEVSASTDYLEREGDDAQVSLLVHFEGKQIQYARQDQNHLLNCEVAVAIYESSGKIIDTFMDTIKGTLTPAQVEEARVKGFRYSKRLILKPGLYQIRLGVRDAEADRIGTTASWVEVPDLSKGKIALSSIFLGKEQSAAAGGDRKTVTPKPLLGRASFKNGDSAHYRFAVYNAESAGGAAEAQIKVEIFRAGTSVYAGGWLPLSSRVIRKDQKGVEAGGQLQLGLKPDIYELRVTVKDAKSKKTAERAAYFEVQP
jgi:VWFA-related protein